MNPIISYRLTEAGAWVYRFYQEGMQTGPVLLGAVSCRGIPNMIVRVEAPGVDWYSSFNMDTVVVPGTSRRVKENDADLYRIVYCEPGFYRMIPASDLRTATEERMSGENRVGGILVERRDNAYLFGKQGMPAVALTERIDEWPWTPPACVPYFRTTVYEQGLGTELLMAILSFPAMRF